MSMLIGNIVDSGNTNVRSNDVVTSLSNDIQPMVTAGTIPVSKIVDGASRKQANVRTELDKYPSLDSFTTGHASNGNNMGPSSLAKLFNANPTRKSVDFRTLQALAGMGQMLLSLWSREEGLHAIETKLDIPLMLDSYTSAMCMDSWGRSSYARVMVELQADVEMKDTLVVVVPKFVAVKKVDDPVCADSDHSEVDEVLNETGLERFSRRVTPLFPIMVVQSEFGKGSAMPTDPHHAPNILQSLSSQPQNTHKPMKPTRKVTLVPQPSDLVEHVADEAIHKELGDSLVRAATTASSLEAEQDNGGGPRVLDLKKTKTTQGNEIASLKRRVKRLEKKNRSRTHKLKRLYKVGLTARIESFKDEEHLGKDASKQERIEATDADEDITLVNVQDDAEMFDVNDLGSEEVFVAEQEVAKDNLLWPQALEGLKTSKPKVKGIVIQEQEEPCKSRTTTTTIPKQQSQDKGKGIMIEEHVKAKKKDQIRLDEEAAKRLQANFDEEERLAREKA
uniref:Uncharacterized protein n=1 Tax=Tanacetum cinerariifolium TaxID=118510 RepID=A0A699HEQ4_TANCI|nr:hypothetical protein [Tanacetum cinerariifolium]